MVHLSKYLSMDFSIFLISLWLLSKYDTLNAKIQHKNRKYVCLFSKLSIRMRKKGTTPCHLTNDESTQEFRKHWVFQMSKMYVLVHAYELVHVCLVYHQEMDIFSTTFAIDTHFGLSGGASIHFIWPFIWINLDSVGFVRIPKTCVSFDVQVFVCFHAIHFRLIFNVA